MLVGGLGTYAENITRKFVEIGHDVSVFTLNPGNLPVRELVGGVEVHRPLIADATRVFSLLVHEDIRRWGAGIKFFSDIFMYNVLSATKLLNELVQKEQYKFDIVSFHDWLSSISGMMVQDHSNIPGVFHVHSTEWGRTSGVGSEAVSKLEEGAAEAAERIITVSHVMKQDLSSHGWPERKIDVVWNGVDPERYSPQSVTPEEARKIRSDYGVAEDEVMILFVGRLIPVKGVRNLVMAMPEVINEYPKVALVILGRGEEQKDIVELADRLGINAKIKYRFEFVPEEQRILHYAGSDLCVFPSSYEPFGIVSLEAMSMEKPVVVGARGIVGFREQVVPSGPDQCGMHVNPEEPSDIAWGIKEILADPERARTWGKNGRKRVQELFTWEKAATQTLNIYNEVISKRAHASSPS